MPTKRYCCKFNWYGEVHLVWTSASCANRAFENGISRLAKKLGQSRGSVFVYFVDGKRDNWKVERR